MIMLLLLTVTCIKFWAISSLIGWDDDDGGDGDDDDDDDKDEGDMYEHFGCPQGVS